MAYDNTCKYLAETYATSFIRWLLDEEPENVSILKTEIIPEPIRADALILVKTDKKITQIEFQTLPYSEPPIPYRMLKYWTLLYGQYWCEIDQIVIFLQETSSEQVFQNKFSEQNTSHSYRVIRLWEEDPAPFLADPALLPLATLTRSNEPKTLLEQVTQQVAKLEDTQQKRSISAAAEVLAGLRFEKDVIRQLFREELMEGSVIYQDILQKGITQGEQRGLQQGEQRGLQQGEANVLIRLLSRRFATIDPTVEQKIRSLSISQLEELTEAQFDFTTSEDLIAWLDKK